MNELHFNGQEILRPEKGTNNRARGTTRNFPYADAKVKAECRDAARVVEAKRDDGVVILPMYERRQLSISEILSGNIYNQALFFEYKYFF